MEIVLFVAVAAVAYMAGVFGFAQIIGSLQNIRTRGAGLTLFTVCFWAAILLAVGFLVHRFFYPQRIAYYIVTVISFLQILLAGKIS